MKTSTRILRNALGFAAMGAAVLTMPGCGKAVEEITETAIESNLPDGGNVEIDSENDTISIQAPDGQGGTASMQSGASVELPSDFPSDIPVPDGVTWNLVQGSSSGMTAQGMLKTPMAEVAAFIKSEAEAQGWTNEQTVQQAGQLEMLTYKKEDRMFHVTVTDSGDETALVISSQ